MDSHSSYFPNYYSINDIMATQETVPCVTQQILHRLGFLIPGSEKEHVDEGTSMELPLWLARALSSGRAPIIQMQKPALFNDRSRDIFEADPKVINLHRLNPHFYEFGRHLSCIYQREAEIIRSLLIKTFKERFRMILDWSDNIILEQNKLQMLESSERRLLKKAHKARALLAVWLVDGVTNMQPAEMVLNLRKRKLMDES